jgi:hypothetical protein
MNIARKIKTNAIKKYAGTFFPLKKIPAPHRSVIPSESMMPNITPKERDSNSGIVNSRNTVVGLGNFSMSNLR